MHGIKGNHDPDCWGTVTVVVWVCLREKGAKRLKKKKRERKKEKS